MNITGDCSNLLVTKEITGRFLVWYIFAMDFRLPVGHHLVCLPVWRSLTWHQYLHLATLLNTSYWFASIYLNEYHWLIWSLIWLVCLMVFFTVDLTTDTDTSGFILLVSCLACITFSCASPVALVRFWSSVYPWYRHFALIFVCVWSLSYPPLCCVLVLACLSLFFQAVCSCPDSLFHFVNLSVAVFWVYFGLLSPSLGSSSCQLLDFSFLKKCQKGLGNRSCRTSFRAFLGRKVLMNTWYIR